MSEWWTYRLSDFLMFEPETYFRLFELLNAALWPVAVLTMATGIGLVALSWRGGSRTVITSGLAIVWLIVAYVFHYRRYATIMLAAKWFAMLFLVEGLTLAFWGWWTSNQSRGEPNRAGAAIAAIGLLGWPLIAPLMGRNWKGAELFGLAPDPTVVVTIGLLLATRAPKWLLVLPVLWCVITGATLWAMQ